MNNNENNNENLNSVSLGSVNSGGIVGENPVIPTISNPVTPMNIDPIVPVSPDAQPEQPTENFGALNDNIGVVPPITETNNMDNLNNNVDTIPEPVNTIPDVNPIPEPVAPANMNQIPTPDAVPPVTPNYEIPDTINNFNATPFLNGIGTVPPIPDAPLGNIPTPEITNPPKQKGGMNKLIFVIIIVLALVAVGVGVYIFLHLSQSKTGVMTKKVNIEVNGQISSDINDYATFNGVKSNNCMLDITGITDTSKLGAEYDYVITCGTTKYTGKAKIVDTIAPDASTKDVTISANSTVKAEDFIDGACNDASTCSYKFKDEDKVLEAIKTVGTYSDIVIVITDEAGNTTEKVVKLIVEEEVATIYLNCAIDRTTYKETTKLGLNKDNLFTKKAVRIYTFTLTNDTYNTLKNSTTDLNNVTYSNITGKGAFDDATLTLTITRNMTSEELSSEAQTTIPEGFSDLRTLYTGLGYSCTIGY